MEAGISFFLQYNPYSHLQLQIFKSLEEYAFYVCALPLHNDPELFVLHSSVGISCAQMETYSCLAALSQEAESVTPESTIDEEVLWKLHVDGVSDR
jgi:hypothetical protein